MHHHDTSAHRHSHDFLGDEHDRNSRRVWLVVGLTGITMVAEITAGSVFGSMALLADGWHMGTHLAALSISAGAYVVARRFSHDSRFAFGTAKFGDLAGFASAIFLGLTAVLIAWEAMHRFAAPVPIAFSEALMVAIIGLGVNLVSAWLLGGQHHDHHGSHVHGDVGHGHQHYGTSQHDHGSGGGSRDNNLRAAYLHVLADALTSVLAIAALLLGRIYGWVWTDPLVALIGAIVIAAWSVGLIRQTAMSLIGGDTPDDLKKAVANAIEGEETRVTDLHVWSVGPGSFAAAVAITTHGSLEADVYRSRIAHLGEIKHATVEVHYCRCNVAGAKR